MDPVDKPTLSTGDKVRRLLLKVLSHRLDRIPVKSLGANIHCNENLVSPVDGSPFKMFGQEITEIAFHLRLEIPTLPRLTRELIRSDTLLMSIKSYLHP